MVQLGISAYYHDSAACLVRDGKVLYAAEQERFTGIKHDNSFPVDAIKWVLKASRMSIKDIDEVCWYENPETKKKRVIGMFNKHPFKTLVTRFNYLKSQENPKLRFKRLARI